MPERDAVWGKAVLAFVAGWFWVPLLVVAYGALSESAIALGATFVVAGCASLGVAVHLSFQRSRSVRIPALVGLALSLVLVSSLAPVRLEEADSLAEVGFGYPVRFVFADLSIYGDTAGGYSDVVTWDPSEEPAQTDGLRLLASWFLVFGGLAALVWALPAAGRWLATRLEARAGARRVRTSLRGLSGLLPILGGVALGLVLASVLAPVAVSEDQPYANVGFGYPVRFLFSDLTWRGTPVERLDVESWDPTWDPAEIDWLRLLASWVVVLVLLTAVTGAARAALRRRPVRT